MSLGEEWASGEGEASGKARTVPSSPFLQQGLRRSPHWARLQGILGPSLWVATDGQELIFMQDMPLGMGTSVLYLCPKGMDVVGLIMAIPLILKGSGFLEARWGQASGGDSSGLPGVAILM